MLVPSKGRIVVKKSKAENKTTLGIILTSTDDNDKYEIVHSGMSIMYREGNMVLIGEYIKKVDDLYVVDEEEVLAKWTN